MPRTKKITFSHVRILKDSFTYNMLKKHYPDIDEREWFINGMDRGSPTVDCFNKDGSVTIVDGLGIHEGYHVFFDDIELNGIQSEMEIPLEHTDPDSRKEMNQAVCHIRKLMETRNIKNE